MYDTEPIFWMKLILLLLTFTVLLISFNAVTRKWLKVEKRKLFSYYHVNEQHKKIDWTIRVLFLVLMLIGFFINVTRDPLEMIWFLEPYVILFVLIFTTEVTRVIMEKRYAENRNDYLFSTAQLVFMTIIVVSMYTTDFFGLFG